MLDAISRITRLVDITAPMVQESHDDLMMMTLAMYLQILDLKCQAAGIDLTAIHDDLLDDFATAYRNKRAQARLEDNR